MKKGFSILLSILLLLGLIPISSLSLQAATEDNVVYLDDTVAASGDGTTAATAVKTMSEAYAKLADGDGKIIVVGTYDMTTTDSCATGNNPMQYVFPYHNGKVTITGEDSTSAISNTCSNRTNVQFTGETVIENIIWGSGGGNSPAMRMYAGPDLTFGDNVTVTCTRSESTSHSSTLHNNCLYMLGGYVSTDYRNSAYSNYNSTITANSGTFSYFYGGSDKTASDDVVVNIGGTTVITEGLHSSGVSSVKNSTVNITGGTIETYYLVGVNANGKVTGDINANISGGTITNLYSHRATTASGTAVGGTATVTVSGNDNIGTVNFAKDTTVTYKNGPNLVIDKNGDIGAYDFTNWQNVTIAEGRQAFIHKAYTAPKTALTVSENAVFSLDSAYNTALPTYNGTGTVELKYYSDVETKEYDFEDETVQGFVNNAYTDDYKHENITGSFAISTNSTGFGVTGNDRINVNVPTVNAGKTAAKGNMSEFISPPKAVLEEYKTKGKYLTSGSFDMWIADGNLLNRAFVFGMDDTNYHYAILGVSNGRIKTKAFTQSKNEEATFTDSEFDAGLFGMATVSTWYHFEFFFGTDNKLTLVASDTAGSFWTFKYDIAVEQQNRMFAFSNLYLGTENKTFSFDNVVLNFASKDTPNDALIEFVNKNATRETLELDLNNITPYDFTRLNALVSDYNELAADYVGLEKVYPIKNIANFEGAMEKWGDVSDDEKIAQSFYDLYINGKSDMAKAYNVYRRLSKTARTAFETDHPTEYAAMLEAINPNCSKTKVTINTVGDSITAGNGSYHTSWVGKFEAKLKAENGGLVKNNVTYEVWNRGRGSQRIYGDDTCEYRYRDKLEYYFSVERNPDIVVIMLGTNDAFNYEITSVNDDIYKQIKTAYIDLIQDYLRLSSNPQIYLASNPIVAEVTKPANRTELARDTFLPKAELLKQLYQEVASEYGLQFIDILAYTSDETNGLKAKDYCSGDSVHMGDSGAEKLATWFYNDLVKFDGHYYGKIKTFASNATSNITTYKCSKCDDFHIGEHDTATDTIKNPLVELTEYDFDNNDNIDTNDSTLFSKIKSDQNLTLPTVCDENDDNVSDIRDLVKCDEKNPENLSFTKWCLLHLSFN